MAYRQVSTVGITSLGIDHTSLLGSTIEDIAWQKAGIMKPGSIAFTVDQQPAAALEVLRQRASEKKVRLSLWEMKEVQCSIEVEMCCLPYFIRAGGSDPLLPSSMSCST